MDDKETEKEKANKTETETAPDKPPVITYLSEQQGKDLVHFVANWENPARADKVDRSEVEAAFERLAAASETPMPPILWCESLWQAVVMQSFLALSCISDDDSILEKIAAQLKEPKWQRMMEQLLLQKPALNLPKVTNTEFLVSETILGEDETLKVKMAFGAGLMDNLKTQLDKQLSLKVKLKIREIFRAADPDAADRTRQAGLNLGGPRLVREQFGFIQLGTFVGNNMARELESQLSDELKQQVIDLCSARLPKPLSFGQTDLKRDPLSELFSIMTNHNLHIPGSGHDFPSVSYAVRNLPLELDDKSRGELLDCCATRDGVFHFAWFERVLVLCERPISASLNERSQLHNDRGPALEFVDGHKCYMLNGVSVPANAVGDAENISLEQIDKETNVEVRRILIQRYGEIKYLQDSDALEVDADDFGVLYKKAVQLDEPIVMVKVINTTPEPDGTRKHYFLRVPPYLTTARAAVAWTFNMKPEEYSPMKES